MTRSVTGRVMPLPSRRRGFKRSNAVSKIDGRNVDEPAEQREKTANSWIRRRVLGTAGQVWQFERVRKDGYIPDIRQIERAARVIHVAMREKNGIGSSVGTIQRCSRLTDLPRMARSSGVYQCPGSAGLADEVHIRDADRQTEDIERDFLEWHTIILRPWDSWRYSRMPARDPPVPANASTFPA